MCRHGHPVHVVLTVGILLISLFLMYEDRQPLPPLPPPPPTPILQLCILTNIPLPLPTIPPRTHIEAVHSVGGGIWGEGEYL
jgi:hypothetical protein